MLKDVVYQQPLGHQNRQLNQNQELTTKLSQSNLCVTEMVGFSVQVVVAGQGGCKRQAMDWRVDTMLPAREPAAAGQGRAGIGISLCNRVLRQPPMKLAPAKVAIALYLPTP